MPDQIISTLKLDNQSLEIKKGLSNSQIDQIVGYANSDDIVRKYTADSTRFATKEAFNEWRKEDAVFYTLTDDRDTLLGLVWFEFVKLKGEYLDFETDYKDTSKCGITIGIRLYGEARGKGLGAPFMTKTIEDFKTSAEYKAAHNNVIWLGVHPENIPGIKVYEKAGFKRIATRKDGKRLLMVLNS